MTTPDSEQIEFCACPTCGAMAQHIAGEPVTYRALTHSAPAAEGDAREHDGSTPENPRPDGSYGWPQARQAEQLPPSCGPAETLSDETLVSVALQCAGRFAMYETEVQFNRVNECKAEILRRLTSQAAVTPAQAGEVLAWQTIETAPVNTDILLWNNETQEIVIGHKPDDAAHDEYVVVGFTAAYADAWHAMPAPPEVSDDDGCCGVCHEPLADECPCQHESRREHDSRDMER